MRKLFALTFAAVSLFGSAQTTPTRTVNQVDFSQVTINDAFWTPRLQKHATATLPVCIDQTENQTGRMRNFINAAAGSGNHSGIFYDDSDVYKAMEGMAYSLITSPNNEVEAKLDEWVDIIAAAQMEDGYLNTYFQLTTEERWKDMNKHEMYCAGHLLEAGIAYHKARGKDKLLNVGIRMVEHMMSLFGPDKRHWVAGHQEIELALVKLYELTGEQKYLDFAYWILEERGHGHGTNGVNDDWNTTYFQDAVPVRDLRRICGHAVRAMYMFCGMADVASYRDDTGYMPALDALWHNVVDCNMYITGGIGSSSTNEGFTSDYDLPNLTAYCETCASIGMVLWNHRMNLFTGESKYIDILERSLYNGLLAGINLDGNLFFYVNPLESNGDHHRKAWYSTACCPSNLSRFLPSMGSYIYGTDDDALWVNLYIGSEASVSIGGEDVKIKMGTQYPWDGTVNISLSKALTGKQLRLRIPGWCNSYTVSLGGSTITPKESNGYAVLDLNGATTATLTLDMPVEAVQADYRVSANTGRRAIQRGPLVYCAEATDNAAGFENYKVGTSTTYTTDESSILGGIRTITADTDGAQLKLIPYYAWDNRTAGKMLVWLKNEDFDELSVIYDLAPTLLTREYGHQHSNIAPIDMKNDGSKQLLVGALYKTGTDATRHNYILQKDGDTWTAIASPFNSANRPSFSPCDINGDGNIDIVMFESATDYDEGIFIGNGDGTFTELTVELVNASENLPTNFTNPLTNIHDIISADVADFDNDGNLDIVGIGSGAATVVLLNKGIEDNVISLNPIYFDNGIVGENDNNSGRNFTNGMVFANDFNNDGYTDILISSDNSGESVHNSDADWERFTEVYLNNGNGNGFTRTFFAQARPDDDSKQNPSVSNGGVAIADFNGDGYLDIFLQGPGGYFWYYWDHTFVVINDGTGHFAPIPTYDFDRLDIRNQTSVPTGAAAYDWNGDGLIDIVYSGYCPSLSRTGGFIWMNGNNGIEGTFRRQYKYAGASESLNIFADWNGDGIKDLINTGWNSSSFANNTNNERSMSITLGSQASEVPASPTDAEAEVNGNTVTLSWTPATDAPASTSYELYFKNEDGVLLGNPRAYIDGDREGQRKVEEFGKLGCVTTIAYTLPNGEYEWGVQAVDGRRIGSKFAKGKFTIGGVSGISNIATSAEILSTEYYDLQGRQLNSQPEKGVFIKKNIMTDGSTKVGKVIK